MITRLILLCQGASEATRRASFPTDEPLEPGAAARAATLAGCLRRSDRTVTSPALAARQTAALFHATSIVEPALRDTDFGRWSGRTLEDVAEHEAEGVRAWLNDPDFTPPGGESFAAVAARVSTWLGAELRSPGRTMAVTHAAVIRGAVLHVLRVPLRSFRCLDVEPLSRTELRGDGRRWTLRAFGVSAAERLR